MIPFVAAITSDPIFAVGDLRLRVEVDLLAEVAEIVLVVGIGAILAKIVHLRSARSSSGPSFAAPVVLKIDGGERFADFVSTLTILLAVL